MSGSDADVRGELRLLAERYAKGVDQRDAETLLSAFHENARLSVHRPSEADAAGEMVGHSQIAKITERIARYPKTFHLLGQSTYEIDGATATGEVYCSAHHLTPDSNGGTDYVMLIRYNDEYRREAGAWRIARRRVLVDWTETVVANPSGT